MKIIKKNKFSLFILLVLGVLSSCKNQTTTTNRMTDQEINEHLTNVNKIRVQKESQQIDDFVNRHQLKVERTGTGLRIQKYVSVKQVLNPVAHSLATVGYKVYLLDGTMCYSSDSTGLISFRLSEGQEARGMEEGLMMMSPGEKAYLVVPMHLAYGLSGDGNKIPPGSALYMDVELINFEK